MSRTILLPALYRRLLGWAAHLRERGDDFAAGGLEAILAEWPGSARPSARDGVTVRFECSHCGKLTAGRRFGDVMYPRRHRLDAGASCPGSDSLARRVEVPDDLAGAR